MRLIQTWRTGRQGPQLALTALLIVLVAALAVPAVADAHILKGKRQAYTRELQKLGDGYLGLEIGFDDSLRQGDEWYGDLKKYLNSDDPNERELAENVEGLAAVQSEVLAQWAPMATASWKKALDGFVKRVKPWFHAKDRSPLQKSAARLKATFVNLIDATGGPEDSMRACLDLLKDGKVADYQAASLIAQGRKTAAKSVFDASMLSLNGLK